MRMKFVGLLGALALAGLAKPAAAIDRTLELGPPKTRASFGSGYSTVEQEFKPQVCVTFGEEREDGQGGGSGDVWKSISNNSELAEEMNLGVQVGFKVAMGVVKASVDTKVNFLSTTHTSFSSQTIFASRKSLDPAKFIKGDIKLKDEYKTLKPSEFKNKCGEFMILGMQEGSEFFGTVQFEIRDTKTLTDFSTSTKAEGSYGTYSANVAFDFAKKKDNQQKLTNLTVNVITTGGNAPATTIEDFEREFKAYQTNAKKAIVKLIAVPYEDIVADWPIKDPLAPMTADEKLDKLTEVAFAHVSLGTDVKFIKQNKDLFALGTTEKNRKAKLTAVEKLIVGYDSALEGLRKDAKGCDTDFSAKCEKLYAKWEKWEPADEYAKLPQRYTSNCNGITLKGTDWTAPKFPSEIEVKDRKGKDASFGNNPVKFTASVSLKTEGKDLLANMTIKAEEWNTKKKGLFTKKSEVGKRDTSVMQDTSYSGSSGKSAVFKLVSDPIIGDLSQCSFGAPAYTGGGSDVAGSLSETTGKKPQEGTPITIDKGAKGILRKMKCSLTQNGKDGATCDSFDFADVKLNLISEQDVKADGGKSAKSPTKAKKAKKAKKPKTAVPGRKGKGKKGK